MIDQIKSILYNFVVINDKEGNDMNNFSKTMFFIFFLTLMFFPNLVKAECSTEEYNKLLQQANSVEITYKYVEDNGMFQLVINNLSSDLVVFNNTTSYLYIGNGEVINGERIIGGKLISFNIKASETTSCINQSIKTKSIQLPYYNEFSTSELCEGIEDYKYCQKFVTKKLTKSQFKKYIEEYKSDNNIIEQDETNILSIIKDNLKFIIPAIILIVVIIIVIVTKKRKKVKI